MAVYNNMFLVFAISLFLTTLPSNAYNNYPNPNPNPNPSQAHAPSPHSQPPLASLTTFEIPKNVPVVSTTGDVSVFIKSIMDATMYKTDEFIANVIKKHLDDPKTDISSKDCLETCKTVFEDAVDAMKRAEEDVKERNYYKANVDVSAMSTNIDTCNECAASIYGEDSEFRKFENWAQGVASDCLDKITTQSH